MSATPLGQEPPPPDPDSPQVMGNAAAPTPLVDATTRGPLNRRTIILAAVTLIDQNDLRFLTMRNLGAHLGVEAMSLYHYVHSREDLLDAVVELIIDDLYCDPDVHISADDWQEYLQRLAHGVRRIALAHPQIFPLIATRPPAAPWIRPPLRSLRWMESFLETLHQCGFSDDAAVAAYRGFSSFLLGHLLLEVSAQGADIGPIEQADPTDTPKTDLSEYPRLKSMKPALSQNHSAEEFEEALESLLDRLEPQVRRSVGNLRSTDSRVHERHTCQPRYEVLTKAPTGHPGEHNRGDLTPTPEQMPQISDYPASTQPRSTA